MTPGIPAGPRHGEIGDAGIGRGTALVDGTRVHYRRAGTEGTTVVLLHGAGVDDATLSWAPTIAGLADDCRVYAPDWPGYGHSESIPHHSTERYVDVLQGFLADRRIEDATLVGLSMGGAAALGAALDDPGRIDRLVLAASYGLGSRVPGGSLWWSLAHTPGANTLGWNAMATTTATTRLGLSGIVHDVGALPDEFVAGVRERARRPDAGAAFADYQRHEVTPGSRARTDYTDRLDDLDVPTLLVHGRQDGVFPAAWSERAHRRLPDSRLELLEDCGHWVPRERPAAFERLVRSAIGE